MKQLYTYTDHTNTIIFKVIASSCAEADKEFEKAIGKPPLNMPMVTCMISFNLGE